MGKKMSLEEVFVFGGAFNPIHLGHEEIVKQILEKYPDKKVYIAPIYNWQKEKVGLSLKDRIFFCEKVFEGCSGVEVLKEGMEDPSFGKTFYMQNFFRERKEDPIFIVGTDSINNIKTWENSEFLIKSARWAVFQRGNLVLNKDLKINLFDQLKTKLNYSSTEIREKNPSWEQMVNSKILKLLKNKL